MTEPPPALMICGIPWRQHRNVPSRSRERGVRPNPHVDVGDRGVFDDRAAGGVVQHVELAVALDRRLDGALDAILLGDVRLDKARLTTGFADDSLGHLSELGFQLGNDDLAPSRAKI